MKAPSSSRSRSGLAWASCSSSIRAGSILGLTVIVVSFFESVLADHSKDHAVAVAYAGDTHTGEPYTPLRDSTRATDRLTCHRRFACPRRHPGWRWIVNLHGPPT